MTELERFTALSQELLNPEQPIHVGMLIKRAASKWPEQPAVICQDQVLTYSNLYRQACAFAQVLKERGVQPDDRVLLYWENSLEFFVAYWGIWQTGAVVAPLNVFLHEKELVHIIQDAQPKALVISDTLHAQLSSQALDPKLNLLTNADLQTAAQAALLPTVVSNCTVVERNIDNLAALLYTSGTTGFPKGVMLNSRTIITNAIQGISRFDTRAGDSVYSALPLFHSFPQNVCVWSTTIIGAASIIVPKVERNLLIDAFKYKPTFVIAVPALYGLFCRMKNVPFGPVRYFFSGGDALPDRIREAFELVYKRKLCNGYGLTETGPYIAVDLDDYTQVTNTVGRPFIGISYSLRDSSTGHEVEPGSVGVLWVKGDNVMLGYYNAPEATQAVLQDGWLNTGDLARIDTNGKIVLVGRERDLISNKGLKIYPQEVENILLSHEEVIHAAVIGVEENYEEVPIALVSSKTTTPDQLAQELKALCARSLAAYKVPRRIIVRKELPVTATGKVNKKQLKAEYTQP